MTSPTSLYAKRRSNAHRHLSGVRIFASAGSTDLASMLNNMEFALASKDAEKIAQAAASLSEWAKSNLTAAGAIAAAIGIAGETSPDLARLDVLTVGLLALISVARESSAPAPGSVEARARNLPARRR